MGEPTHQPGQPSHAAPDAGADPGADVAHLFTREFWDERYGGAPVFSGEPNPWLVHHAAGLAPGTALDVGSGEGADVLWLASRGWHATGVDISPVALARSAELAERAGADVAARTAWQQADVLTFDPPPESFDLVSAQFLHLPGPAREALHRRLAAAVRPGGTLLLVLHFPPDPAAGGPSYPPEMFTTARQMASVLDPAQWAIDASDPQRQGVDPERAMHTRDAVLRAVRRS